MGKLKNKLIDEQDQKLIEAEKQEQKPVRDWAEIAADDEARYQASRGNTGVYRDWETNHENFYQLLVECAEKCLEY